MPRAVKDDLQRIVLWVQGITGLEMNAAGGFTELDPQTWQKRRKRLEELGGPPMQ